MLPNSANSAARLAFFPYENAEGVFPENLLTGGESRSGTLRLHYPADVTKLKQVTGLLVVARGGTEEFHEISTPPPSAKSPVDPGK